MLRLPVAGGHVGVVLLSYMSRVARECNAWGGMSNWLDIDRRALREWAISPLAITLGLRPIDPSEAPQKACGGLSLSGPQARQDPAARCGVCRPGSLGHHSHRVPGHNCGADEWLALYVEHIVANLQTDLVQLEDKLLACDCPLSQVCEGDILAGLVFDAGAPKETPHPPAAGRPRRSSHRRSRRVLLAAVASNLPRPVGAVIPYVCQEAVISAFTSFYPADHLAGFRSILLLLPSLTICYGVGHVMRSGMARWCHT